MKNFILIVYAILKNGEVYSKPFPDMTSAYNAYENAMKMNLPCKLSYKLDGIEVDLYARDWGIHSYNKMNEWNWKQNVRTLLEGVLNKIQLETVLGMKNKALRNAVACNDTETLMELPGIGEKSAKKVILTLREVCKPATSRMGRSKEFARVILNNDSKSRETYSIDTIRKMVSPLEDMAMQMGGKDAVIHVTSWIKDVNSANEEQILWAELLRDRWYDFVVNGIMYNGIKYKVFGHGTNSAKECKTIAVKETIYDDLRKWVEKGTNPLWQTTPAKKIAYEVGLHSVYHHKIDIPFQPEEVCIFPTVITEVVKNTTKQYLNGTAADFDNDKVPVKWTDGLFFISISEKKRNELISRMVEKGRSIEEATEEIDAFINDISTYSYRADGAAWKGLGVKFFNVQAYLKSEGKTKTPDGRDIDDIVFFVDETVIKTPIGKDKAYETFADWCDAVHDEFAIGTLVKTHAKSKKDVSYQVLQSLCEATQEQVEKMAQKTVDRCNNMHTIDGASKLLGKEWGTVLHAIPELANVREFKGQIERGMRNCVNEALSGKLLHDSYYSFVLPDPFFAVGHWFGIETDGCLKAGQIHHYGVRYGKVAMWRSPVMHPNSVRVMNNVGIKEKFKKFMRGEVYAIILNCHDDVPVAMDMDFDGDHANDSDDENLIEAVEETLKVWDRLIIWETPDTKKSVVGEKEIVKYLENLTHKNELGLTVFGLNALLNGLKRVKDKKTGAISTIQVPVTKAGVNFKKFAANVLVDASKHGGGNIDEPAESAQCRDMLQPWAKLYQDAVEHKQFWYVKMDDYTYFFQTEEAANDFYDNNIKEAEDIHKPVNYLDELADPKRLYQNLRYKPLNKLFAFYAENIRRDTKIDNVPEGEFDFHKLMFNPAETVRHLDGLWRFGKMAVVHVNGEKYRPDQGLFNSLARQFDTDLKAWRLDESNKDKEESSFAMTWRANALAQIQTFAEMRGATLQDAYDVVTWRIFAFCDNYFERIGGKADYNRDGLWRAYKVIFGGMALQRIEDSLDDAGVQLMAEISEESLSID